MPRGDHYAARVRAARAYADLERPELGSRIGYSKEMVSRLESGERSLAEDPVLLRKIANACGVPALFMEAGFGPLEAPISDVEREVHELRTQITARLVELEGDVRRLAGAGPPGPRAGLGRDLAAAEPSRRSPLQTEPPEAPDAPTGTER